MCKYVYVYICRYEHEDMQILIHICMCIYVPPYFWKHWFLLGTPEIPHQFLWFYTVAKLFSYNHLAVIAPDLFLNKSFASSFLLVNYNWNIGIILTGHPISSLFSLKSQEKRCVNSDPFLHRIYTIGLYTI